MRTIIGQVGRSVLIESVVLESGAGVRHVYRLIGGPEDGREFQTMAEVGEWAVSQTQPDADAGDRVEQGGQPA